MSRPKQYKSMKESRPRPRAKQAQRIIDRFGNAYRLARAIKRQPSTVYKWTYPKSKGGTGGVIPTDAQAAVQKAAKDLDIELTMDDWFPDHGEPRGRGLIE